MPSETLRFLERKGLVSPRRNEANGYRYYSGEDIQRLIDYRWYRDAGYSVADTIATITGTDLFQMAAKMEQAEAEAHASAKRQAMLAERLKLYRQKLSYEYLTENMAQCKIEMSPEIYFCVSALEDAHDQQFKFASQFAGWFEIALEYYSFLDYIALIYFDGIVDERMDFGATMGYGMEATWAKALGVAPPSNTIAVPAARCAKTIVRVASGERIKHAILTAVSPFLDEEGLAISGDVWANRFAILNEQGVDVAYFEAWVPVK